MSGGLVGGALVHVGLLQAVEQLRLRGEGLGDLLDLLLHLELLGKNVLERPQLVIYCACHSSYLSSVPDSLSSGGCAWGGAGSAAPSPRSGGSARA